jgi:hypothetical protein
MRALILAAIILLGFHIWQFGRYIPDDAAITFAYAKNLAAGNGLVLNPGTDPVEGYSNFGWLLVVLPFCARGNDPTIPVKILSFVIGAATLALVARVGRQLAASSRSGSHEWLGAAAALGLAAFTPYAAWASSGLENGLYCALFVAALFLYLRDSYVWCAVALVSLSLTRVEGAGLAALFALHRAGTLVLARSRPTRAEIAACLVFVSLYGTYFAWHWWHFLAFVPNSYLAKSVALHGDTPGSVLSTMARGWTYALDQLIVPYRLALVAPFAIVGLMGLKPRVMTLLMLLLSGVCGLVLLTGGDFYPQFRLGTLVLPLLFLLVGEGTRLILSLARAPRAVALVGLLPLIVVCLPSIAASSGWGEGPMSVDTLKPIRADRYVAFSRNIRKRPITVMESEVGNVAYFTDFSVLDLGGLSNLQIARYGFSAPFFLHQVFEELKPDVIHLEGAIAANANIPMALIERDYQTIEGLPTGSHADGWYVRRDPEHPYGPMRYERSGDDGNRIFTDAFNVSWVEAGRERWVRAASQPNLPPAKADPPIPPAAAAFPATSAPAAQFIADVRRRCDDAPAQCHLDRDRSSTAQARAESYRRESRFVEAFDWYMAAWEANRRNIAALRGREDMRVAAYQGCLDPPAAPASVQSSVNGSTVTLRWNAGAGAIATYLVEAGSASGLADLAHLTSDSTTFTINDVARRVYHVRVKGRNACGVGPASNEVVVLVR